MFKTFITDMDDTLNPNHHDYEYAKMRFTEYMFSAVGYRCPDLQELTNLQTGIDVKLVKEMGFGRKRFPTSFVMSYEQVCAQLGIPVEERRKKEVFAIGMLAFDKSAWSSRGLIPGVAETLDFLLEQGDDLILMTKGDARVQREKIMTYGLRKWFSNDHIHIVPSKSKEVLLGAAGPRVLESTYHVGNSIRSDVEPALEAGMRVIYIPCETWEWKRQHNGVPVSDRVLKLERFKDIKDVYHTLN